jgi:putative toxin-antitoxin system antitoxin component (TIGR02293 family)
MALEEVHNSTIQSESAMLNANKLLGLASQPAKVQAQLRNGLPYKALIRVVDTTGINLGQMAEALDIPKRTLMNHRGEGALSAVESDKLYRFTRIFGLAEEMTGSAEEGREWLMEKAPELGGVAPITLLSTDHGARRVEELIERIMWGMA